MSTITQEQQQAIASFLVGKHIPVGLGSRKEPCSIAAINLALRGKLTDKIPECMSPVVGNWIIYVQDAMPDAMRNSERWRSLLPLAAGTGRKRDGERLAIILDWIWGTVLPSLQPLADKGGFGGAWCRMTTERTAAAAAGVAEVAAEAAAAVAAEAAAAATAEALWMAYAARLAARAAELADRTERTAEAAARAAEAAEATAEAVVVPAEQCAAWERFDPCGLLERLVA